VAKHWPKRIRCSRAFQETSGSTPTDAVRLIQNRFAAPFLLGRRISRRLPAVLGELGIAGGAVYDALVGLAAVENGPTLATRDERARPTDEVIGADIGAAAVKPTGASPLVRVSALGACVIDRGGGRPDPPQGAG
jgi:hypothetical protein